MSTSSTVISFYYFNCFNLFLPTICFNVKFHCFGFSILSNNFALLVMVFKGRFTSLVVIYILFFYFNSHNLNIID
ncbi:hypothetical protein ES332_D03G063000v1 [Gossypium tomentosum]|uniref:Uncharacterized protein n=1 Tax=Gossypium tomentosum TaxID=34277 RepID=A0A5D2LMY9_GOSTO|nr:hypothetical protein ES332_D03G063000v1 [Gossypium tomentosum]